MLEGKLFMGTVVPAKKYNGRKEAAGVWQRIISEIPKCELFIDAMCGSGFVGSIVPNCHVIYNDIDRSAIDKIVCAAGNTEFLNVDYREIIKRFDNGNPGRIFYFDPPYLMSTRSYQKPIYRFDWKTADHEAFLEAIRGISCPTLVSHYPCPLYDKSLHKWRKITYRAKTRAGSRDERLYMNYPQPVLLQCHAHIGQNFTDRQRIKRKIEGLTKRLDKLPGQERAAILTAVIEHYEFIKGR